MEIWGYVIMWLVLAGFFTFVELESFSLVSIWFALGALVAAITAAVGVEIAYQIVAFSATSLVTLLVIKIFFPNLSRKTTSEGHFERIIGKEVEVIEGITHLNPGSGKIDGVTWSLITESGEEIAKGQVAKVVSVSGNRLLVKLEKGN